MNEGSPLNSLGSKLDHAIQVTVSTAGQPLSGSGEKSYAKDKYADVEVGSDDRVSHPYDADCPWCHNLRHDDMVAMRGKMRTEQAMKYDKGS